ncbi:MAG TPA: transposase [Pyrinomonadaceae bacterium]|nr:transposase [Pyrinomonadaceae bacterium]
MKKYDDEFKQNAVKKILDGQSVASVARELGVGEGLLHKWKRQKIESSSDLERENLELKKRLREAEMERDILKKAALIFGRGSWNATDSLKIKRRITRCRFYAG